VKYQYSPTLCIDMLVGVSSASAGGMRLNLIDRHERHFPFQNFSKSYEAPLKLCGAAAP